MKRGIAKEEEMKLGKKIVVTIGVLLSALLCVNMILYTPASADGNTKLKTSKNDISSETVNMHQGVSMSYAQIVQTYSDEYQKLSKFLCQNNLQTKMSYKAFCKIEYNLYETEKLKPYINATICCLASYTSPKGRNHYVRKWILPFAGLVQNYNKVEHLIKQKATLQYRIKVERSKMSDSLRFDVL